ncbi:hypothetical protein [Microvirga pudoricolor]|uniref:hypothetical protein n=1 Tax=Microvirga pudoricolor TaxID=2778729 RepID=UPI00194FA515|nr:hypothetical protein [Microvirga pudoricolor]MBM6594012.1 hypothetical protein [Microvirga pudoricolor]
MCETVSAIYPISLDQAFEAAECMNLSGLETTIEVSPFSGYFCSNLSSATMFMLRFDAQRWPADDPDVFLMITASPEVNEAWYDDLKIQMVAVEFGSLNDLRRFEMALWT